MTLIYADEKRTASTEDFQLDWSLVVGVDSIASSVWTITTGLTQVSSSNTTTSATVRLTGGVPGHSYTASNVVTLLSGVTQIQSLLIPVVA